MASLMDSHSSRPDALRSLLVEPPSGNRITVLSHPRQTDTLKLCTCVTVNTIGIQPDERHSLFPVNILMLTGLLTPRSSQICRDNSDQTTHQLKQQHITGAFSLKVSLESTTVHNMFFRLIEMRR